jgi:hypothetical protein
MSTEPMIRDDSHVQDALNAFVRRALPEGCDVRVEYALGVATLRGEAPSPSAALAVADLMSAHDGVESVINLVVVSPLHAGKSPRPA